MHLYLCTLHTPYTHNPPTAPPPLVLSSSPIDNPLIHMYCTHIHTYIFKIDGTKCIMTEYCTSHRESQSPPCRLQPGPASPQSKVKKERKKEKKFTYVCMYGEYTEYVECIFMYHLLFFYMYCTLLCVCPLSYIITCVH